MSHAVKEHYVFADNYYDLKTLTQLLRTPNTDSQQIINYITEKNIDVNSYLELTEYAFVPIIYQVVLTPVHLLLFKWLIRHGAKINKVPDCEHGKNCDHILFAAHEKYLNFLIKNLHCKLSSMGSDLNRQILKKISFGNLKRIKLLIKCGALTKNQLLTALESCDRSKLAFESLNLMLDRINLICKTHNQKSEVDKVLQKYVDIITLINPAPLARNDKGVTLLQYCANFYLHPIIAVLIKNNNVSSDELSKIIIYYHVNLDEKIVAAMRQLYNDRRYIECCDLLEKEPDRRAF